MAQPQLLFEGSTPEQVILSACAVHGPDVRLSAPERIRTGGVGGFFAKSRYRVRVIPRETPAAPARTTAPKSAAAPASTTAPANTAAPSPSATTASSDALERFLAESPDVSFQLSGEPSESFAEVLSRAAGSLGESPYLPPAAAFPAAPPSAPLRDSVPPSVSPPVAPTVAPGDFDWDALVSPAATLGLRVQRRDRVATPQTDMLAEAQLAGLPFSLVARATAENPSASLTDLLSLLTPPPPLPRAEGALIALVGPTADALEAARAVARRLNRPLQDVALALGPARRQKGSSRDQDLDGIELKDFAPDLVARTVRDAGALAPGWRRDRVGIVAVSLADPTAVGSARQMLAALRPSAVYALVPAAAKPEDVAVLSTALGGVDALHLEGCRKTFTPAAICSLDLPVARLDGDDATAERWAFVIEDAISRRRAAEKPARDA